MNKNKYLFIVLLGMIFTASIIISPAKGDIKKLAYKSEKTIKLGEHIILEDDYLLTFEDIAVDNKMALLTLKRKTDILERFLVQEGEDITYKNISGREKYLILKGYVKKVWHNKIEIYVERFKYILTGNLKITGTTKAGIYTENITLEIEIKPRMTVEKHINLEKLEKILEKENIKITEGNVFDLENDFALAISKVDEDKNTAKISIIRNEDILLTKNIKTGNELIYENIISVKLNTAYTASINNRLKGVGIVSIVQYSTSPKKQQTIPTPYPVPLVTPIFTPTTIHTPPSINLHGEKTDVVLGEEIVLSLSVINPITNPTMTAQVIIIPPSGMSVTSSGFAEIIAGQYSTTYKLKPGEGKDIEVRIKANQIGKFEVKGSIVYYFGEDKEKAFYKELKLQIKVRPEVEETSEKTPIPTPPTTQKTPGFTALMVFIILLILLGKKFLT